MRTSRPRMSSKRISSHLAVEDPIRLSPAEVGRDFNFNSEDVSSADVTLNDEPVIYYYSVSESERTEIEGERIKERDKRPEMAGTQRKKMDQDRRLVISTQTTMNTCPESDEEEE